MIQKATITESDILADVMAVDRGDLTPAVARSVLRWRFSKRASSRIARLSGRGARGIITAEERQELEKYLRVGGFVNILQAKARLSLKTANRAKS